MSGLSELAAVIMDTAQRRIDVSANNISNLNTPGFRAKRLFQHIVDDRSAIPVTDIALARRNGSQALKATGNPLDIAVTGTGMLLLRVGDRLITASSAQLRRDVDGRLVTAGGGVLQAAGGGDIIISGGAPSILRDGIILVAGQPEAKIGMFTGNRAEIAPGELPDSADDGVLHQGMLVASDVDLAAEMVDLTRAGRLAEAGAKVFQLGDELLGKVASTVGEMRR